MSGTLFPYVVTSDGTKYAPQYAAWRHIDGTRRMTYHRLVPHPSGARYGWITEWERDRMRALDTWRAARRRYLRRQNDGISRATWTAAADAELIRKIERLDVTRTARALLRHVLEVCHGNVWYCESQSNAAKAIGCSRETVNRLMRVLVSRGFLRLRTQGGRTVNPVTGEIRDRTNSYTVCHSDMREKMRARVARASMPENVTVKKLSFSLNKKNNGAACGKPGATPQVRATSPQNRLQATQTRGVEQSRTQQPISRGMSDRLRASIDAARAAHAHAAVETSPRDGCMKSEVIKRNLEPDERSSNHD